jgi:hypothetical protein
MMTREQAARTERCIHLIEEAVKEMGETGSNIVDSLFVRILAKCDLVRVELRWPRMTNGSLKEREMEG